MSRLVDADPPATCDPSDHFRNLFHRLMPMEKRRIFAGNGALSCHVGLMLLVATCTPENSTAHTEQPSIKWQEGQEFHYQLSSVVEMDFTDSTLERLLGTLEQTQRICCFRDRRIDPNMLVQFTAGNQSLGNSLRQLAAQQRIGMTVLGSVVYFGPREDTERIDGLLALQGKNEARLPKFVRGRLQATRVLHWPMLAEPRQIIQQVARNYDLTVQGIDRVPHDLWASKTLPSLAFSEQMTILTHGFGLTYRFLGPDIVELVSIPDSISLPRSKSHDYLPASPISKDPRSDNQRYTFTVPNRPARDALQILASRFRLELVITPDASERADRRVTVQVREATRQEALASVTGAAELEYKIQGERLIILKKHQ